MNAVPHDNLVTVGSDARGMGIRSIAVSQRQVRPTTDVRAEYRLMAEDLPELARTFGCALTARELFDIRVFLEALECIDRIVDGLPTRARRHAASNAVISALIGNQVAAVDVTLELRQRLSELRDVLARCPSRDSFLEVVRRGFANSERMRYTTSVSEYIALTRLEGSLLVEVSLMLLPSASDALVSFLRMSAAPSNLFDKLVDARQDFDSGELAIRPSLAFYARLAASLFIGLPVLVRQYPRRWELVRWLAGYVVVAAYRVFEGSGRTVPQASSAAVNAPAEGLVVHS